MSYVDIFNVTKLNTAIQTTNRVWRQTRLHLQTKLRLYQTYSYTIYFVVRCGSTHALAGRFTEAWGLPHGLLSYYSWDTWARLLRQYWGHRCYQPSPYSGHHHQEAELTNWPRRVRIDDCTPAHRALSQAATHISISYPVRNTSPLATPL